VVTVARAAGTRWPLQPLLDACQLSHRDLAGHVGAGRHTVAVAATRGLSDDQADRWAIRLGFHPLIVWGWSWIDAARTGRWMPSHARVTEDLRDRIECGELRPGDELPSNHALTQRWRVGGKTVTRAVAELRAEGLVTGGSERGCRHVVAGPVDVEDRTTCAECGEPIDPGAEHFPHRASCTLPAIGWCDCDHPTHPQCCPTCLSGARP